MYFIFMFTLCQLASACQCCANLGKYTADYLEVLKKLRLFRGIREYLEMITPIMKVNESSLAVAMYLNEALLNLGISANQHHAHRFS